MYYLIAETIVEDTLQDFQLLSLQGYPKELIQINALACFVVSMIDTIRLKIPVNDYQGQLFVDLAQKHFEDKESKYQFYSGYVELGSWNRKINFFPKPDEQAVYCEFSVPKQLIGHNIALLSQSQVLKCLQRVYVDLSKLIPGLISFHEWEVVRLDLCHAWKLPTQDEAAIYLDLIKNLEFPRKKRVQYVNSVFYAGSDYSLKFYLKGPEFLKHDFGEINKSSPDRALDLVTLAFGVLRYEITLRNKAIKKLFNSDLVNFDKINYQVINNYLEEKLIQLVKLSPGYMDQKKVQELLLGVLGSNLGARVYGFYRSYYSDDPDDQILAKNTDDSTRSRYLAYLKKFDIKAPIKSKSYKFELSTKSPFSIYHQE